MHGVRSFDNVFMNPDILDNSRILHRAIGRCAYLLGSIHAQGFTHGDAQVKNMFENNSDKIFIADLRSVKPFPTRVGSEHMLNSRVNHDLSELVRTMREVKGGKRELPPDAAEQFSLIYHSITNAPTSEVPDSSQKSIGEVIELFAA
jgi:hypothetical protein